MANQADISSALQQKGVNVYGLQVANGSVTGTVASDADRQKVYETVAGIDNSLNLNISIDTGFAAQEAATPAGGQTHVVKDGENLRRIARQAYGDEMQWKKIYEANKAKIGADPDKMRVGTELTIPA